MLEKIIKIIQIYKNDDTLQISESSTFDELELDSLDLVQIVMDVEETFGITIEVNTTIANIPQLMEIIKKARE